MLRQTLPQSLALLGVATLLAACATSAPAPGTARDDVLRGWGTPTARYELRDGGQRLEYATGPWGRTTWMIDIDGAGRVAKARQVLNEAEFFQLQSVPSLSREELLRWIGTPAERRSVWRGGETWSWRYPTNDCLWFQASLDTAGRVTGSGYGIDPICDAPSDRD